MCGGGLGGLRLPGLLLIGLVGDGVCWKDVDAWRAGSGFDLLCMCTYHNFALQLRVIVAKLSPYIFKFQTTSNLQLGITSYKSYLIIFKIAIPVRSLSPDVSL